MVFKEGDIVQNCTLNYCDICIVLPESKRFVYSFERTIYNCGIRRNFNPYQTTYIGSDDLLTYINIL